MSTLDQLGYSKNRPSTLLSLIGDTLMIFTGKVTNDFGLDNDISECVPALCELAAGALVWILINREEEYTDDYVEGLFNTVRSKTSALLHGRTVSDTSGMN